jgi:hypothetical protein
VRQPRVEQTRPARGQVQARTHQRITETLAQTSFQRSAFPDPGGRQTINP